ncbi:MAG: hypothetical protein QXS07_02040 [Candidatus Pacearchaeota archaeon]
MVRQKGIDLINYLKAKGIINSKLESVLSWIYGCSINQFLLYDCPYFSDGKKCWCIENPKKKCEYSIKKLQEFYNTCLAIRKKKNKSMNDKNLEKLIKKIKNLERDVYCSYWDLPSFEYDERIRRCKKEMEETESFEQMK